MKEYLKWLLVVAVFMILGGVIMAHEKVYVVCENMCIEEAMTKEQAENTFITSELLNNELDPIINDLNVKIDKSDIKVLSGSVTLDANTSDNLEQGTLTTTTISIAYPEGYTKDNCIVLAFDTTKDEDSYGWNSGALEGNSTLNVLSGSVPRIASLRDDSIKLTFSNYATNSITIKYKLYLLKII